MVTAAGTMTQWQARHSVKGRKHSQMTKNLLVCLHDIKGEVKACTAK